MAVNNLETLANNVKTTGHPVLKQVVDYVIPFMNKYDVYAETDLLCKDPELSGIGASAVLESVTNSYEKHRRLLTYAKIGDTADRVTSTIGVVLETIGVSLGVIPGFSSNLVEEAVEMAAKIPAIAYLAKNPCTRSHAYNLIGIEAMTAMVPIGGDVYDILTNRYMRAAYDVIRQEAKQELLQNKK